MFNIVYSKDTTQEASVACPPPHGSPIMPTGLMAKAWSHSSSAKTNNTSLRDHSTWHCILVSVDITCYMVSTQLLGTSGVW